MARSIRLRGRCVTRMTKPSTTIAALFQGNDTSIFSSVGAASGMYCSHSHMSSHLQHTKGIFSLERPLFQNSMMNFQSKREYSKPGHVEQVDFFEEALDAKQELVAEESVAEEQGLVSHSSERITKAYWCVELADSDYAVFLGLHGLTQTGIKLMPFEIAEVLRRLTQVSKALSFFKWVTSEVTLTVNADAYDAIIKLLGDRKKFGNVWNVVADMKNEKGKVPDFIFMTILRSCGNVHDLDEAVQTFNRMEKYGCKPNADVFNCIIEVLLQGSSTKLAQEYIDRMRQDGFELNQRNQELLAENLGKKTKVERAYERILEGQEPLTEELCCDKICKLCRARKLDEAYSLFTFMTSRKLHPTTAVYETLARVLAEAGRTDEALSVLKLLLRMRDRPTYFICVWVASSLIFDLRIPEAYTIQKMVKRYKFRKALMKYVIRLSEATLLKATWDLLRFMKYSGYQPDRGTYIACHVAVKPLLKAHLSVRDVIRAGGSPMLLPCNLLVKCLTKRNQSRYARPFVRFMQKKNVLPNAFTYSCLIKSYYRADKSELGRKAFEEMRNKGFFPDRWAYSYLIKDAAKTVSAGCALDLFEEMLERHGIPKPRARRVLIEDLLYQGSSAAAIKVYRELKARGALFRLSWQLVRRITRLRARACAHLVDELEEDLITKQMKRKCE